MKHGYGGFKDSTHRGYRDRRGPRPREEGQRGFQPKPMPIGRKCNPLCPYFRCSKRALVVKTEFFKGRQKKTAYCRWIGDACIGARCQYAYCALRALLPNGDCMYAVQAEKEKKKMRDMFEELSEADLDEKAKSLMTRRLGKKDLDFI